MKEFLNRLLGSPQLLLQQLLRRYLLGFGLVICVIPSLATATISSAEQRRIDATRTEASYNAGNMLVRENLLDTYLSELVKHIIAKAPDVTTNFRIHAMTNALPYVYCLDNGAIYISTGLLARVQNESQLVSLIAPEMASLVRQDAESNNQLAEKQGAPQRVIPNLVLIAFTAGLAAIPIVDKVETEKAALKEKLQLEANQLALQWLTQNGFDIAEAPRAAKRLLDTLTLEDRFGTTELSNRLSLEARLRSFNSALPETLPSVTRVDSKHFREFARHFALELAQTDRNKSNSAGFYTVLDRFENEYGKDGESSCLRADYEREITTDESRLGDVLGYYESCIQFANAPAPAFRELAFLQRRLGNNPAARRNFELYLQKQPRAVDAPIVRSYMESL